MNLQTTKLWILALASNKEIEEINHSNFPTEEGGYAKDNKQEAECFVKQQKIFQPNEWDI